MRLPANRILAVSAILALGVGSITAQTSAKDAQARQTQTQTALQNLISDTEGIDQNQVASQILQLQTNLQASYQTTAMLSQLSLVKFLPLA